MKRGLVLNNVSKRFGDYWALRDVRAVIPMAKITAFIGPNGAGKTTLLHVIGGTLKPDAGTVTLDGEVISGRPPYTIARIGIGRQFQDVRVFKGLTVLQNVMVAAFPISAQRCWAAWFGSGSDPAIPRQAENEALQWLEYVGMADQRYALPQDLSFGQQKLVSLARLFARRSRFLLLDEPTSGLSHQMVDRLVALIQRAVDEQGLTVVLVEHNMRVVADLAYWIHFLHEGRIAFSGETAHVLGNKSVREIYMGL
jgi:ABC-type branched-subunit amino acid transport system ATPase component